MSTPVVIIPNWNGRDMLAECLDALAAQTIPHQVVIVDNGSTDGSKELIHASYPYVHLIERERNYGFTGGVNPGLRYAIDSNADYGVLLNNDAVASQNWLEELVKAAETDDRIGIVTSKIIQSNNRLDSTGDFYTVWGMPFPRGREEIDTGQYDDKTDIFAASGGASLYRTSMLRQIGLFDDDFFAYYEDVDISFRAQLAGWKVRYQPTAVALHYLSQTSGRIKGFGRYHTVKNFHFTYLKDMPAKLYLKYFPRYFAMTGLMLASDLRRGLWRENLRANGVALRSMPKTLRKRRQIQKSRVVSNDYIEKQLVHQLPPNLRNLTNIAARLTGKLK